MWVRTGDDFGERSRLSGLSGVSLTRVSGDATGLVSVKVCRRPLGVEGAWPDVLERPVMEGRGPPAMVVVYRTVKARGCMWRWGSKRVEDRCARLSYCR